MRPRSPANKPHLPNSPFRPQPIPDVHPFEVNDRLTHDRHGMGSVVRIIGDRLEVKFGQTVVSIARNSTKIHPL